MLWLTAGDKIRQSLTGCGYALLTVEKSVIGFHKPEADREEKFT